MLSVDRRNSTAKRRHISNEKVSATRILSPECSGIVQLLRDERLRCEGGYVSCTSCGSFQIWWWTQSVWSYFQSASLPGVSIEHVNCASCFLSCSQENGAVTTRSIIRSQGDISTKDCPCFAEEILEVLPSHSVRKLMRGISENMVRGSCRATYVSDKQLCASVPQRWGMTVRR